MLLLFVALANTNALNEMLKRVQHDKNKCVIPNLFRNLDFGNDNKSIAFVLVCLGSFPFYQTLNEICRVLSEG